MASRFIDPSRRALNPTDWPRLDQDLWRDALSTGSLFDTTGRAAHWRPATRRTNIQHYGRWLGFLAWKGLLDPNCTPAERVTRVHVRLFHEHLDRTVAPYTQLALLVGLKVMVKAMHPSQDWTWLAKACNRLQTKARRLHTKPPISLSCGQMDALAQAHIIQAAAMFEADGGLKGAIALRDALMLALMVRRPLRIRNFTALSLGTSIKRVGSTWRISIADVDTKNGDPIDSDIPLPLVPFLELYLTKARMLFPGAAGTDRLWLNKRGRNCHANWIHPRITQLTAKVFGLRLNPHKFRDVGATFLAYEAPQSPLLAASLLSHRHLSTTKRWYLRADNLRAAERINTLLAEKRSK